MARYEIVSDYFFLIYFLIRKTITMEYYERINAKKKYNLSRNRQI